MSPPIGVAAGVVPGADDGVLQALNATAAAVTIAAVRNVRSLMRSVWQRRHCGRVTIRRRAGGARASL
jgi:hypothetical protein